MTGLEVHHLEGGADFSVEILKDLSNHQYMMQSTRTTSLFSQTVMERMICSPTSLPGHFSDTTTGFEDIQEQVTPI
jgi:hypothetical protein